jgi:hypothetical protein
MTPTAKLRWVKKFYEASAVVVPAYRDETYGRVLQQWWAREITYEQNTQNGTLHISLGNDGEWRDVPLEEET